MLQIQILLYFNNVLHMVAALIISISLPNEVQQIFILYELFSLILPKLNLKIFIINCHCLEQPITIHLHQSSFFNILIHPIFKFHVRLHQLILNAKQNVLFLLFNISIIITFFNNILFSSISQGIV